MKKFKTRLGTFTSNDLDRLAAVYAGKALEYTLASRSPSPTKHIRNKTFAWIIENDPELRPVAEAAKESLAAFAEYMHRTRKRDAGDTGPVEKSELVLLYYAWQSRQVKIHTQVRRNILGQSNDVRAVQLDDVLGEIGYYDDEDGERDECLKAVAQWIKIENTRLSSSEATQRVRPFLPTPQALEHFTGIPSESWQWAYAKLEEEGFTLSPNQNGFVVVWINYPMLNSILLDVDEDALDNILDKVKAAILSGKMDASVITDALGK